MSRLPILALGIAAAVSAACGPRAGTIEAASAALKANEVQSIEFTGTGKFFQFGQAPAPGIAWPQFDVSNYTASINYQTPAARVQMTRIQTVEPGRVRPTPVEQKPDQYVSGTTAWNVAVPAGSAPGTPPAPVPQAPATVEERTMEIWVTPHGFLKAAATNNATTTEANGGSEVSFTANGHKYVGTINAQNQVERVQTWIDNPIMGDTLVQTVYSDYKDFGGVMFPGKIARTQGGFPVLDITVSSAKTNPTVDLPVPAAASAALPPVTVTSENLAPGVFYLKGGTHHSVAIEQADHVVVVEGPQTEARSLAVIAKVKELIPNKPLKYLINTHVHFDHSGGLRTWVDEGSTIVTHAANKPYYEEVWKAPHTLNPDKLEMSKKAATFETFTEKHTLTDGKRTIEIYPITGSGHNDAFAMIFLPAEGILIEADAYTPAAANAPAPTSLNPFWVNLNDNVTNLKLKVKQIAALHGPRVVTMDDLRAAIASVKPTAAN